MSLPPKFWSDLLRTTAKRDSVVNIAVIGPPECGKSTFIRKAVKNLCPQALPPIRRRGYSVACTLAALNPPPGLETTRILEINSAILSPGALWPEGWPRLDGVILCYDASNPDSFKRIPELVSGYHAKPLPMIVVACKTESTAMSPETAADILDPFHVGLVEATATTEKGKDKMRMALAWTIQAILRRRGGVSSSTSLASTSSTASSGIATRQTI